MIRRRRRRSDDLRDADVAAVPAGCGAEVTEEGERRRGTERVG